MDGCIMKLVFDRENLCVSWVWMTDYCTIKFLFNTYEKFYGGNIHVCCTEYLFYDYQKQTKIIVFASDARFKRGHKAK